MKIRARLTAASLACIIPMWFGIIVIAGVGRTSDRTRAISLMQEYAQGVARGLEAFFYDARTAATVIADMHGQAMLGWQGGAEQFVKGMIRLYPSLNNMSLAYEDGLFYTTDNPGNPWQGGRMTMNNADPDAEPLRATDNEFFRVLVTDNPRGEALIFVGEPEFPPDLNAKAIITSAAVIHEGRAAGTANAVQTLTELGSLYAELTANFLDRFGTEARLYLVSRGGQLISSLEYNRDRGTYVDTLFGSMELVYIRDLGGDLASIIESSVIGNVPIVAAKLDGIEHFIADSAIEGTPYVVCIAVPSSALLSASRIVLLTTIILFFGIAVMMTLVMYAVTKPITASLSAVNRTMQEIAQGGGDLTVRLEERGNDEIAEISENFNQFVATLNLMIGGVGANASSMSKIARGLSGNVTDISGRVFSITEDIENLNFEADEQSASVTETSSAITQIAQTIESLSNKIERQSSAVTESSAAVHEMVSNMGSISDSVSRAASSFDELRSDAASGKESITNVQELVYKLSAQSDALLEANSVIESIASQTNLLAMNAAIEAAHAGEAGKGFAIVAEEIRNLAENSAEQSRAIASTLKEVVKAFGNIAEAASIADSSFDSVAAKIDSVTSLVGEINFSMAEQSAGSRQVLVGLEDIESVTMQIRDGAVEMNSGAAAILKEMSRLSDVSLAMQDRSASIARAAEAINDAIAKIVKDSGSNSEAISMLVSMTEKFKL